MYLHMEIGILHAGSPAKVFAATPLLIMIMRIVLSFGRVNKQRPTNERAPGTHQAQADVD